MADLEKSSVHRNLDAGLKLFGFELFDLAGSVCFAAVMQLFFSGTILELPLGIGAPTGLLMFLYYFKKGKPKGHLMHAIRYNISNKGDGRLTDI